MYSVDFYFKDRINSIKNKFLFVLTAFFALNAQADVAVEPFALPSVTTSTRPVAVSHQMVETKHGSVTLVSSPASVMSDAETEFYNDFKWAQGNLHAMSPPQLLKLASDWAAWIPGGKVCDQSVRGLHAVLTAASLDEAFNLMATEAVTIGAAAAASMIPVAGFSAEQLGALEGYVGGLVANKTAARSAGIFAKTFAARLPELLQSTVLAKAVSAARHEWSRLEEVEDAEARSRTAAAIAAEEELREKENFPVVRKAVRKVKSLWQSTKDLATRGVKSLVRKSASTYVTAKGWWKKAKSLWNSGKTVQAMLAA